MIGEVWKRRCAGFEKSAAISMIDAYLEMHYNFGGTEYAEKMDDSRVGSYPGDSRGDGGGTKTEAD